MILWCDMGFGLTYIIYFSYGFSEKSASIIGILIGAQLKQAAKKFAVIYIIGMLVLGMVIGSLIFVCSDNIISLYISRHDHPLLFGQTVHILSIYTLYIPHDSIIRWIMRMSRTLNLGWILLALTVGCTIIGQSALCWYVYSSQGRVSALTVLNISYSMYCVVAVTMLLIFAIMDWEKIHHEPPEYALTDEVDILNGNTEMDKKRAELKQDIN